MIPDPLPPPRKEVDVNDDKDLSRSDQPQQSISRADLRDEDRAAQAIFDRRDELQARIEEYAADRFKYGGWPAVRDAINAVLAAWEQFHVSELARVERAIMPQLERALSVVSAVPRDEQEEKDHARHDQSGEVTSDLRGDH